MAVTQKTTRINDWASERLRTTSKGTTARTSINVKAEAVEVCLDEKLLAAPVAVAIKKVIEDQIKEIAETAKSDTLFQRKYARNAFDRGERWATKRYSGGKTGPKEPGKSDAMFNDSGRLAEGLSVRPNPTEDGFTINVPSNRLDKSTFKTEAEFRSMLDKFGSLVPAIGQPSTMLSDPRIQEAIKGGIAKTLVRKNASGSRALAESLELAADIISEIDEFASGEE